MLLRFAAHALEPLIVVAGEQFDSLRFGIIVRGIDAVQGLERDVEQNLARLALFVLRSFRFGDAEAANEDGEGESLADQGYEDDGKCEEDDGFAARERFAAIGEDRQRRAQRRE